MLVRLANAQEYIQAHAPRVFRRFLGQCRHFPIDQCVQMARCGPACNSCKEAAQIVSTARQDLQEAATMADAEMSIRSHELVALGGDL